MATDATQKMKKLPKTTANLSESIWRFYLKLTVILLQKQHDKAKMTHNGLDRFTFVGI